VPQTGQGDAVGPTFGDQRVTTEVGARSAATELLEALADDRSFEAWYRRTMPRVYAYLLSRCGHDVELAEELTQRTFVAAIEQRWRFDGRSDITTWLCGIARHKLADHYRGAEREQRRQIQLEVREIDRNEGGSERPSEDRELIAEAFRSLPPSQRAVLVFVDLDGLSVPEAARLMGKNRLATQSLLHRARDRFRHAFRGEAER
jgi:RNA polymerase sigma-70 factor (ECF subfamily)